jgi:hypothetical protein
MERLLLPALALCLLVATACREEQSTGAGGTAAAPPLASPGATPALIEPPAAGTGSGSTALTWTTPTGWVAERPTSSMRRAQYRVPGEAGDAECVVFYFGPGQGGDPMANAQRWASQFTLADGRPGSAGLTIESRQVGDIDVLSVEVGGTYQGGFTMQRQKAPLKPNQLLLGAIATGPDANWFFKLTGPEATVEAQRAAFETLVGSLERGGPL